MRIVRKNTEVQLYKDLKGHWERSSSLRSVYFRFSILNSDIQSLHDQFIHFCRHAFSKDIMDIYICHDGDIFLNSDCFTAKHVDKILKAFEALCPDVDFTGVVSITEIRVDWSRLRRVVNSKIENFKRHQAEISRKNKEVLQHVNCEETLQTLNRDLINTISMRREAREQALVMVVEDDPFTQKLIHNTIDRANYDLEISSDGQGAVMMYVNKAPDILFLDIGLPDIDGHRVLEKLFEIDPNAFVVMFSGNGDKSNVLRAIELGAKGFVGKPFTKDKIIQYIEKSPFIQLKKQRGIA